MAESQYLYNWVQPKKAKETATLLFLAAFFFLFLFRPFTVNEAELKYPFLFVCFLHALSPALIVFAFLTILVYFKDKGTQRSRRSIFHGLSCFVILFFIIGLASFLLRDLIYTNPHNWSLRYFWEEIRNSYLAGSLFTSYFILASFYFYTRKKQAEDIPLTENTSTVGPSDSVQIFIQAQVKVDNFQFDPAHFLFARAEGNYVELSLVVDHHLKKVLKRISLKQLELQLENHSSFLRCHRTYLINMEQVSAVSGNSQGYYLSFPHTTDKVPVSRAQLETFDQRYQALNP
ncbi:LytTR family DNA-binding domain-containing protein [Pedobacter gandavensis]|uniref:LytTR family DNA-binding domain-containing protein n=1 Tax=Pedobacter gandavensis TaxID=2679963 RepID=UPI00292CE599|nr:LytTR family DNA-binding domain-containing protein [Pedobacter gandavensis]